MRARISSILEKRSVNDQGSLFAISVGVTLPAPGLSGGCGAPPVEREGGEADRNPGQPPDA